MSDNQVLDVMDRRLHELGISREINPAVCVAVPRLQVCFKLPCNSVTLFLCRVFGLPRTVEDEVNQADAGESCLI